MRDDKGDSENLEESRKNEKSEDLWKPQFFLGFGKSKSN